MATILHIDRQRHWSGQQARTFAVVRSLRGRGHRVLVACQPGSKLEERVAEDDFQVSELPMRGKSVPLAMVRLARICRRERIDLIHAHGSADHQITVTAALLTRRPRVVRTKHNAVPLKSGIFSRMVYSRPLTSSLIAVSDGVRQQLLSDGIETDQVALVTDGVNAERFRPRGERDAFRAHFGFGPEHVVIGSAGRLADSKGEARIRKHQRIAEELGLPPGVVTVLE